MIELVDPNGGDEGTTSPKPPNGGDRIGLTFTRLFYRVLVFIRTICWSGNAATRSSITKKVMSIFKQEQVEVPVDWTQLATDIASSKYLRKAGVPGVEGEDSVRQLVTRVARTLRRAGEEFGGYFATAEDAETFEMELTHIPCYTTRCLSTHLSGLTCGLWHEYNIEGGGGNYYWGPRRRSR